MLRVCEMNAYSRADDTCEKSIVAYIVTCLGRCVGHHDNKVEQREQLAKIHSTVELWLAPYDPPIATAPYFASVDARPSRPASPSSDARCVCMLELVAIPPSTNRHLGV